MTNPEAEVTNLVNRGARDVEQLWLSSLQGALTPAEYQATVLTGELPKAHPDAAFLADFRQELAQPFLDTLGRPPSPEEWQLLLEQAEVCFALPDGSIIDRAETEYLTKTLWESYLYQPRPTQPPVRFADHLTLKQYFALVEESQPPKHFADLLADGITAETAAYLTPDFVQLFNELRPELEVALSQHRPAPPSRADWLAIAKLAHC